MAIFPRIQSPCPYKDDLAALMEGDTCTACKRKVFDLTALSDAERVAFFAGCAEEVCVSYKAPLRLVAAAALAAAALAAPMSAAAQDTDEVELIIIGGIKDPAQVEFVADPADLATPELPVVYEPAAETPSPAPQDAEPSPALAPNLDGAFQAQ